MMRIRQNGERFCIYQGDSAEPMECHPTRAEAEARMREMGGMMAGMAGGKSLAVTVKSETPDTLTVAGWGVVFDVVGGGADLTGERFTKDTDFWLGRFGATLPVLYDHSFNDAVKAEVIGTATITPEDDGLWVEAELTKHSRYVQQISKLANAGALGWSSGAVAHLVEAEPAADGVPTYKRWPIAEMSLTPTPAEPRTLGVAQLRSLAESTAAHAEALKALLPQDAPSEGAPAQDAHEPASDTPDADAPEPAAKSAQVEITIEDTKMPELEQLAGEVASIKSGQESLNTKLESLLQLMQDQPATKNAGYFTQDGGAADPQVKSFGDFLLAIKRGDSRRLAKVYGAVKDLTEGAGNQGGYLVPAEHRTQLLQVAYQASPILGLVEAVPVNTDAGTWPALDQFISPTAGSGATALAAGITAATTAEGVALTETTATFKEITWRATKRGGYTEVSNELVADSPLAIESLLRSLFGIAISSKRERDILRGTGVGEPLGLLSAPCAIGVGTTTNNVFAYADALNMVSRFKAVNPSRCRWVAHRGVLPDFGLSGWTQGNQIIGIESLGYGAPIYSEHMPQDDNDDVLLADLSTYLLFVRQELAIAYSEHAAFTSDKGTWRFVERTDGQPWLKGAITLADPQGSYTVSTVVYHDD